MIELWRRLATTTLAVTLLAATTCPQAAGLPIYDESLQSGFVGGYSYGGGSTFGSTLQAHIGTHSVEFVGDSYNAVSFTHPTASFALSTYPTLHFWIRGGSSGGQQLELFISSDRDNGVPAVHAPLNGFIAGGSISGSQWREVTVPLTQPPLSAVGSVERFDLQSEAGGAVQAAVYIDDVSLQGVVSDPIFANGFESSDIGPAPNGLVDEHDVTVGAMVSDRFTWRDSANLPRVAVLAHNDQLGPQAVGGYVNHGGAMREFRYQLPGNTTRIASVTTYGNGGYGGFGYVVSHSAWLPPNGFCNGDDSPLGYTYAGTWQRIFEGRHHAIFRFQQNYERHCTQTSPASTTLIPVTIDWIFSTGHDHPLWSITYDMNAIAADKLFDDSRAPYGELNMDGNGSIDISGVAWGDKFKFTSTSAPVTLGSTWTWNTGNTVPYVKEWIVSSDATMGLVQTQTISQQDAGAGRNPNYHDLTPRWGTTSAGGNAGGTYLMPWQDDWPYQANADNLGPSSSNNNSRLTWGSQYGFLGQTTYASNTNTAPGNDGPFLPGWPWESYSVFVVLDRHSVLPVEAQVTEVETIQGLTLSASIGNVATTGPAGVNRVDTTTYAPVGYDKVYSALTFAAAANVLDATITLASGTLHKPLVIVRGVNAYPTTVKLNNTTLILDTDYFPSLRPDTGELWITLNVTLSGAGNHLQILP